ncbi:MAG: hypothetical protein AAB403_13835, partial [Planctomycetota bacterium]
MLPRCRCSPATSWRGFSRPRDRAGLRPGWSPAGGSQSRSTVNGSVSQVPGVLRAIGCKGWLGGRSRVDGIAHFPNRVRAMPVRNNSAMP